MWLGLEPKDIDLVTDLKPATSRKAIENAWMKVIPDTKAIEHGIVRIGSHEGIIDLATLRRDIHTDGRHAIVEFTDKLEEDLARRDLTMNAMAMEIDEDGNLGQVVDPFGGVAHLEIGLIEFVGSTRRRLEEDYLRMVRACRFTALNHEWRMTTITKKTIAEFQDGLWQISEERIRDEFLKALSYPVPSKFFRALRETQLLQHVCDPLDDCVGVEQNEYHAETVFEHLMGAVDASVGFTNNVLLRMAALLHDVGKPATKSVGEDKRIHFFKHEVQGMIIADNWMRKMKFSNQDRRYVTNLIKHHQWRFMPDSKDKTIRRWLRDVGESWQDLVILRMADRQGNKAKAGKALVTGAMRDLIERATAIIDRGEPIFDRDLAINGDDLKDLGIKPGPIYKKIFADLWALVLNEPHRNTREELIKLVERQHEGSGRDRNNLERGAADSSEKDSRPRGARDNTSTEEV